MANIRYRRRRSSKGKISKRRAVSKALASRRRKATAKVVKAVMARSVETKVIQTAATYFPRTINSTTVNINDNCVCLTPINNFFINTSGVIINQGTDSNNRIGAEIKMKAAYLSYSLVPTSYSATLNPTPTPIVVKLYFFKPKAGQQQGPDIGRYISNSGQSDFFENINNVDSGLAGNLSDLVRKLDRDNYMFLGTRTHKIGQADFTGSGNSINNQYYSNNDFKFMARGSFKITAPKKIAYDRQTYPKIQPVYCLVQVLNANNSINPASYTCVQMSWNLSMYYTDA